MNNELAIKDLLALLNWAQEQTASAATPAARSSYNILALGLVAAINRIEIIDQQ